MTGFTSVKMFKMFKYFSVIDVSNELRPKFSGEDYRPMPKHTSPLDSNGNTGD